ncbi:response regulator [Candidatus Desantisbacteria bacterium]|nr:response regulator [Candidatus Desantisbacteria bacterium]
MKKTVLIVEDDIDIQSYYEALLSDMGLKLLKAYNGKEAFTIIDSEKNIDLIILDIVMPIMNGEEFLQELKLERKLNIPVILSSVDEISTLRLTGIYNIEGIFYKLGDFKDLKELVLKNI